MDKYAQMLDTRVQEFLMQPEQCVRVGAEEIKMIRDETLKNDWIVFTCGVAAAVILIVIRAIGGYPMLTSYIAGGALAFIFASVLIIQMVKFRDLNDVVRITGAIVICGKRRGGADNYVVYYDPVARIFRHQTFGIVMKNDRRISREGYTHVYARKKADKVEFLVIK